MEDAKLRQRGEGKRLWGETAHGDEDGGDEGDESDESDDEDEGNEGEGGEAAVAAEAAEAGDEEEDEEEEEEEESEEEESEEAGAEEGEQLPPSGGEDGDVDFELLWLIQANTLRQLLEARALLETGGWSDEPAESDLYLINHIKTRRDYTAEELSLMLKTCIDVVNSLPPPTVGQEYAPSEPTPELAAAEESEERKPQGERTVLTKPKILTVAFELEKVEKRNAPTRYVMKAADYQRLTDAVKTHA